MSATGRTKGLRDPADNYVTPTWAIDRLLEELLQFLPQHHDEGKPAYWLDPCAGEGHLIKVANANLVQVGANVRWHACEIRPECEERLKQVANPAVMGDFLKVVPARYDVVLTNPPYGLAEEFVRACVPISQHTIILLRLNWLENRAALLREHPADVYVLPDRPSFGLNKHGKVGADATAYAWFHWHAGSQGRLHHLAKTPKAVRAAYRKELFKRLAAPTPGTCDICFEDGFVKVLRGGLRWCDDCRPKEIDA